MRIRNGKLSTTDGPFAETKEQLGGYYLIDARDRDEALKVAARIPGAAPVMSQTNTPPEVFRQRMSARSSPVEVRQARHLRIRRFAVGDRGETDLLATSNEDMQTTTHGRVSSSGCGDTTSSDPGGPGCQGESAALSIRTRQ